MLKMEIRFQVYNCKLCSQAYNKMVSTYIRIFTLWFYKAF